MELYEFVAEDVGYSTASIRRRQIENASSATPSTANPGLFETLRAEAVTNFKEKKTDNSQT
jgi:hypothetical protein